MSDVMTRASENKAARVSEDGAAVLERASAPSRPERRARGEWRAGVASSEREECRDVEIARSAELGSGRS
jgi:hypothetical protein